MSDVLRFDLAKDPKGNPITYGRVGDSNGLVRRVKVFEDGKPFDLTGWTTTFEGNTSKYKTKVFDSEGITIINAEKGEFSYTFPNMAFAVEGQYERAYFSFIKSNARKTTGNFEIIVFGNSDIDVPEAETIITEYNKLVTELRKLQDQAIADMNQNFAATQAKISELEKQLSDTQSELQQALKDFENGNFWTKEESFNKEESFANVIYQAIGKETVKIPIIFNFEGKVATSNIENPHRRLLYSGPSLGTLGNFGEHTGQDAYDKISKLDGVVDTRSNNISGNMRQERMEWNIVEGLTKALGVEFFSDQGVSTTTEKVRFIRSITKKINPIIYGRGSSVGGNKLSHKRWFGSWESGGTSTISSSITKLELPSENENTINSYIQDSGFGSNMVYAEASDGAILSTVIIDYACLELTIELSLNQYFKTLIANNHVENLATQAEAEAGASDSKSMSPLRSKQQIDKRVATDTEILAGTNKTQLLTPYSTKLFYDSQEKNRSKFLSVRTKYAAHRGNNSVFPENSLEAFKSVTRHEFFECDVQVTKDDEWIVMHDTTVDRTTNGTGNVKDLTYAQIRALKIDAGSNINNLQDWQKVVPDLSEVCQCARYGKSIPMIEIKGGAGEVYSDAQLDKFMDTLHQFRMLPDGAIVISFDADILARIRQRSNEIELLWIQNSIPLNGLDICKANRFGIDVAYNSATLTKENITAFHKAGLLVGTWTTPEANHQKQEGLGVDIITTDSKSGFLRYGSLTLKNGFTGNTNNGLQNYNVVEEISAGQVRAYFNVLNGVNTSDSIVATFPDWAVPFTNSWQFCNIRTSSGSILATANVMGKTSGNAGISIGLNWTQRTTWAAGVLHWSLY